MLSRKTKLWIFIGAASVVLASAAAVVFTNPKLFKGYVPPTFGDPYADDTNLLTGSGLAKPPTTYDSVHLSGEGVRSPFIQYSNNTARKIGNVKFVEGRQIEEQKLKRLVITMKQCNDAACSTFKATPDTAAGTISLKVNGTALASPRSINTVSSAIFDNLHSRANAFTVPDFEQTPKAVDIWFTPSGAFPYAKNFEFGIYGISSGSLEQQPVAFAYTDSNMLAFTKAYCTPGCVDSNNLIIARVGSGVDAFGEYTPKTIRLSGGSTTVKTYTSPTNRQPIGSILFEASELPADRINPKLNEIKISITCASCSSNQLNAASGEFWLHANDTYSPLQSLASGTSRSVTFTNLSAILEQDGRTPAFSIPKDDPNTRTTETLEVEVLFKPPNTFPKDKEFRLEIARFIDVKVRSSETYQIDSDIMPFIIGGLQFPYAVSPVSVVTTPRPAVLPVYPQCGDLVDNDGDGLRDLLDPGCSGASDNDETDPAPAPPPPPPPVPRAILLSGEWDGRTVISYRENEEKQIGRMEVTVTGTGTSPKLSAVTLSLLCDTCTPTELNQLKANVKLLTNGIATAPKKITAISPQTFGPLSYIIPASPSKLTVAAIVQPFLGFPKNKTVLLAVESVKDGGDLIFVNKDGILMPDNEDFIFGAGMVPEVMPEPSPEPDELQPKPTASIDSKIHVSRADDTPDAASFQQGAQANVFKVFAFVPDTELDGAIKSVTFTKFGTTPNSDFDEVRLYEGDRRFEPGVRKTFDANGKVTFAANRVILAGKDATFTLWMKLKDDALAGSAFYFSIARTSDVGTTDDVVFETETGAVCPNDDSNCVRSANFNVVSRVAYAPPPTMTEPPSLEEPEEPLSCEEQGLFTYTGRERPGRTLGMCIPCRTNLYVATNGTCDLDITGLDVVEEEPAPEPTLESTPRMVQAPEKSDTGPEVLVYFAILGAANLVTYLRKRKRGKK